MFHAFVILRRIEYLQGFLWILLSILFKELIENLGIPSIASVSRITNVRMLIIGIWMILRILETLQYGNFWNFKLNDVSLLRDFLMQCIVSGFMCPFYACLYDLETKYVLCSHFIFLLHCWKIATNGVMPFSCHNDHFYIFQAKFISTGVATRCESWDNTYYVYISLCFIIDVLIPGPLKMYRRPMLYSSNVNIMKVLSKSDENKYGNISNNSQVFAYRMINDSSTMDLITLRNSVEFVQKFQAPYFQICAINISKIF